MVKPGKMAGAVLVAAMITSTLTGCGGDGDDGAPSAGGTGATYQPLVVAFAAVGGSQAPIAWSALKGYYEKAGLDVKIQALSTGTTAALVAGRVDLTISSPGTLLAVANQGKEISSVYQTDSGAKVIVAADPAITSPTQCTSMATGTAGSNVRALTALGERVWNVKWTLVEQAAASGFAPTVISGRTDCGIGSTFFYAEGVAQGKLHVIFDSAVPAQLPPSWPREGGPSQVLGGLKPNLEAKADTVAKFLEVYNQAVADFKQAPSAEIAATLVASKNGWDSFGVENLAAEVEHQKPIMAPNNGYITETNWRTTAEFLAGGGLAFLQPDDPKWSYASVVDMSYYEDGIGKPAS